MIDIIIAIIAITIVIFVKLGGIYPLWERIKKALKKTKNQPKG